MAKKKSKKMKPKQGTGLSREGGQEDLTYIKLNSLQRRKPQTVNRRNLMILLKNILRISPVERVYIIWSGKMSKDC